ncbi:hypothetical protein ANTPLA_LOCUS8952 [Anthophora plagiata]
MAKSMEQSSTLSASQGINISTLRRKRGNIVGHITTFSKLLDNAEQSGRRDLGLLRAHLTSLHEIWTRFDAIQLELEEADESEEPRRFQIHGDYVAAVARANALIEGEHPSMHPRRNITDSPALTVSAPMTIKLPEMRLPTFDGKIENWASYYQNFSSMIDQNADLTTLQKLQYLRSTLTGKAAACIESLSMTDADYADALELLKEKFDCKRKILLKHCDAIIGLPKLTRDSPEALGDLVDTIRQNLRSLKNLKVDTSAWDCILVSIILTKISSDTAFQWELSLKDKQMPAYTNLLDFLEKYADCSPTSDKRPKQTVEHYSRGPSEKHGGKKQPSRSHAFVTASQASEIHHPHDQVKTGETSANPPRCPICHDKHVIWHCEKFHALSAHSRLTAVRKASLCANCLRAKHNLEMCKKGSCRICKQHHHTLLHQPRQTLDRTPTTRPTNPGASADKQVETTD